MNQEKHPPQTDIHHLSPARAYWNQRFVLAESYERILSLARAIDDSNELSLPQWAQLIALTLEFKPELILILGRANGSSLCAFTEAARHFSPACRVLSLDKSRSWHWQTRPRIRPLLPASWFEPVQALHTNILTFDYEQALRDYHRVLLFWDAPGYEVAGCVLGKILPLLLNRPHLVVMHDLSDARYLPGWYNHYGKFGLWKGKNNGRSKIKLGHIISPVEQAILITDFASRNQLTLHSADHDLHVELGSDPAKMEELSKLIGAPLFSLLAHWAWFSLNEHAGPYHFPGLDIPLSPQGTISPKPTLFVPRRKVATARIEQTELEPARYDLTVVATARNDDHGGNLLQRMQLFVSGLLAQCRRHQLKAELILVEWNPPPDKPCLAQALAWPADLGPACGRIVTVPPELHHRFNYADRLPLFQMLGKNVGIRRAQGRFVLATNVDLLFSDALMAHITSDHLRPDRMYRIDRYDVPAGVPGRASLEAQLEYCGQNVLRINRRDGVYDLTTRHLYRIYEKATWRSRLRETLQDWRWIDVTNRSRLHTNGCGDFTLLARENWFALRGYPEFELFSMHLDSVFCFAAHHAGFREVVLPDPMRIYHIEHGSGWSPAGEKQLAKRLEAASIPQLDFFEFDAWATQLRREPEATLVTFNGENWGLADEALPETRID